MCAAPSDGRCPRCTALFDGPCLTRVQAYQVERLRLGIGMPVWWAAPWPRQSAASFYAAALAVAVVLLALALGAGQ